MLFKVFIFELMLFFSYVFYRNLAKRYQLRVKQKDNKRHIRDIIDLSFYGLIVYLFIFFNNNGLFFDYEYILIYFVSLITFGFVLEIPGVAKPLPQIKSWNLNKLIAIILFLTLSYNCGKDILIVNPRNIALLLYFMIILIMTLITSYYKNKLQTYHPHHWQIFWFLSLVVPIGLWLFLYYSEP